MGGRHSDCCPEAQVSRVLYWTFFELSLSSGRVIGMTRRILVGRCRWNRSRSFRSIPKRCQTLIKGNWVILLFIKLSLNLSKLFCQALQDFLLFLLALVYLTSLFHSIKTCTQNFVIYGKNNNSKVLSNLVTKL